MVVNAKSRYDPSKTVRLRVLSLKNPIISKEYYDRVCKKLCLPQGDYLVKASIHEPPVIVIDKLRHLYCFIN